MADKQISRKTSLADYAKSLFAPKARDKKEQKEFGTFNSNVFSPGEPLQPVDGEDKPRQYQFQVGRNLIITPRQEEPKTNTSFATLRALADNCDLIRIAVETRKEQISGMEWDIVAEDSEDKKDYSEIIKEVKSFFEFPDKFNTWYDWLGMILEDILVVDALAIYKRPTKGGKLYSLDVVDGTSIKVLLDSYGRVPTPPFPAYQQVLYGYPRGEYTTEEILYRPKNKRSFTPYGFSPVEYILMVVNLIIRRETHYLSYYTDGSLPDGGMYSAPDDWTPDQISQFQEYFDTVLSGNSQERQRMRFVPGGGKYISTKQYDFTYDFDQWLATLVCAAFGVNPQIFKKQMNRSTAQIQETIQTDVGLKPLQIFLSNLMTQIIKKDLGYENLKFAWIEEKKEEETVKIQKNDTYVKNGIVSIDEVRAEMGKEQLGIPNFVMGPDGPIFLTPEYVQARIKQQIEYLETPKIEQTFNSKAVNENEKEKESTKTGTDESSKQEEKEIDTEKYIADELNKYEKFAMNRLKKKSKRNFECQFIPKITTARINEQLKKAESVEEIKRIFKAAKKKTKKSTKLLNIIYTTFENELYEIFADTKDKFLTWAEKKREHEKILAELEDYHFVGAAFKTAYQEAAKDYYKVGWDDGQETIKNFEPNYITLDLPEMRAAEWSRKYAADMITNIDDSTRKMIRDTIESSVKAGESWEELQARLKDNYGFSDYRAELIARTESGNCYNIGAVESWSKSGVVENVLVSDGDDFDDECRAANGSIWTLEQAIANPLEHPNCIREFEPILREDLNINTEEE